VEDADDEELVPANNAAASSSYHVMFSEDIDRHRDVSKESRKIAKVNNRIDKIKNNLGSSREMQQLFSKQADQSTSLLGNGGQRVDDEGYETIHLTSASNSQNQLA